MLWITDKLIIILESYKITEIISGFLYTEEFFVDIDLLNFILSI
jgi:hypothetical protein